MSDLEVAGAHEKTTLDHGNGSKGDESDDSFANPSGLNEKSLVRKLDLRLLPPLTLLYLLSFLDRSNGMYCTHCTV